MPLGITSTCYLNSGTYVTPIWNLLDLIADATVKADWNSADASVRRGRVEEAEPTNLVLELTGKVRKSMTDTAFLVLRAAHLIASTLDVLILDGLRTVNGSEGFRFDGKVFQWSEDQSLGVVTFKDFMIKPCISTNLPKSVIVNGGSPTYSAIGP